LRGDNQILEGHLNEANNKYMEKDKEWRRAIAKIADLEEIERPIIEENTQELNRGFDPE
jgi:hypothetical protein